VIRWHRTGFKLFWAWKRRRNEPGRPAVAPEVCALIRQMSEIARPAEETAVPRRAALRADLAGVEGEIAPLTGAIARAPDLGSLLDALRATEHRRA
jgi:hypothetical protein